MPDYGYNAINNRIYVKYLNGRGDHYDYDSTQQLTLAKYNGTTVETTPAGYTSWRKHNYDPAGNRTTREGAGPLVEYDIQPNNTYSSIAEATVPNPSAYDGNRSLADLERLDLHPRGGEQTHLRR